MKKPLTRVISTTVFLPGWSALEVSHKRFAMGEKFGISLAATGVGLAPRQERHSGAVTKQTLGSKHMCLNQRVHRLQYRGTE